MYLTLEVISPNGEALGENRRKVIGAEGAQIGRDKANEWIVEGKQVSRQHARVRYLNGAFYIEGLGKNTLAINDPRNFVPNHSLQMLSAGDTVFVGEFEVKASISRVPPTAQAERPAPSRLIPADPFAVDADLNAPAVAPAIPAEWEGSTLAGADFGGIQIGGHEIGGPGIQGLDVDPLALLDGGARPPPPAPLPHVDFNQGSVLNERGRLPPVPEPIAMPPPVPPAPRSTATPAIPDSWDLSRIKPIEKAEPVRPPVKPPPPAPSPPQAVEWPMAERTPPPARPSPQDIPRPGAGPRPSVSLTATAPSPTIAVPLPPAAAPPPAPVAPVAAAPPLPPAGPDLDLAELLRAAGVTAANVSPTAARDLGQVLRIVIEGVMVVLRAREAIKSEFGIPLTRIQSDENNPLKFSANVEDVVSRLLAERARGYLSAPRAFEDAFADIRNHQLAVLEGIRSAFQSMLERFDPERLQEEFDRQRGGGGLLNIGGKGRLWDQYTEHFRSLTRDPDECFRRLFGEELADAYEKQLERLKTTGRHSRD